MNDAALGAPLTKAEIDYIEENLLEHGNDDSILTFSELDGFFTAIISGPEAVMPSVWYSVIWNGVGNEPDWETLKDKEDFLTLLARHMNFLLTTLMSYPEEFEPLFMVSLANQDEEELYIAEDWCFGYMRGVELGRWPKLP